MDSDLSAAPGRPSGSLCIWQLAALATLSAAACGGRAGSPPEADAAGPPPICEGTYARALDMGPLTDTELVEASGLAASRQSPGVLWSHNDSGDSARLFALRDDGQALARLVLPGVQAIDFEDLALGPCPAGQSTSCLWIADTGNNLDARVEVTVYATPEPEVGLSQDFVELEASAIWRFPVTFPGVPPGAPIDIEAMMMASDGQRLYFLEKNNEDRARIFQHPGPLTPDQSRELLLVGDFATPGLAIDYGRAITAADMHPSGERMLLRVYTAIYEYRFPPGQGVADLDMIDPVLVAAGPLTEPQGEAVAYDAAGSGVFSVSEDPDLIGQQVHFFACE